MTLQDAESEAAGRAERALNRHLNGGCQVPIGLQSSVTDSYGYAHWLVQPIVERC